MTGDLDRGSADQLDRTVRQAQRHASLVVLDLRELSFMDCGGVRTIMEAHERALRGGGRVAVARAAHRFEALLTSTGARDVLEVVDLDPSEPPVHALVRPPARSSWCPCR